MICCKNIVNVALFFLIPPQISATTNFFFPPIFGNGIATIATNFFPPILAMALSQTNCNNFFPSYFGNDIATNPFHSFLLLFILEMICAHNFYNIFTKNFKW